jgi:hypothetical protein
MLVADPEIVYLLYELADERAESMRLVGVFSSRDKAFELQQSIRGRSFIESAALDRPLLQRLPAG